MAVTSFKIDGTVIKNPSTLRIADYLVTDMKRNAAGDMNGQVLGVKRKIFFTYDAITGAELRKIYNILLDPVLFHTIVFVDDGVTYTKTVYPGDLDKTLHRTGRGSGDSSTWIWKDVSFNLIEK